MEGLSHYLIFRHNGSLYGIRALSVREILRLPELIAVEELPFFMAGVFNLRGRMVPVMDLDLRFGHSPKRYGPSDFVIVLEAREGLAGVIVNETLSVEGFGPNDIERPPAFPGDGVGRARFIEGEAKSGDDIIMLLDLESLIAKPGQKGADAEAERQPALTGHPRFNPDALPEDRAVMRARAHALSAGAGEGADDGAKGAVPMAVVVLNGEYFGVELKAVRGFTVVDSFAPVPCAPEHIVGSMNARGEILTLIDIRGLLKMPVMRNAPMPRAAVADAGGPVGVVVEDIVEVISVRDRDVAGPPVAADAASGRYIKGSAPYRGRAVTILDMEKILSSEELVVNDAV